MEVLAGIPVNQARNRQVSQLPEPWCSIIGEFIASRDTHLHKQNFIINNSERSFNLHKAVTHDSDIEASTIVLIEDLTELATLEAELVHSERLASVGRLAAGVAHEIGNPVTGIACLAQNLDAAATAEDVNETSKQILQQTQRISDIVRALVNFSHTGKTGMELQLADMDLLECLDNAIQLVHLTNPGKDVEFHFLNRARTTIHADKQQLTQVFVNLLGNAVDASSDGGRVSIDIRDQNASIQINICDDGHGIETEHLEQIFEPFFTTKDPGKGTGLGLPLSYHIIQDHNGNITAMNRETGGTCFCVELPR